MEDTTRLKLILAGLVLAAIALGYFIFIQRRNEDQFKAASGPIPQIQTSEAIPTTVPTATPTPTEVPATLGQTTDQTPTTKGGQPLETKANLLPATGTADVLLALFSVSAAIIGFSLRKFPK